MYGPTDKDFALMAATLVIVGIVVAIVVPALWHFVVPIIHAVTAP